MTSETLLTQVLALPAAERADLAARLIASLDETVDEDAEEAWATEIERRVASFERGETKAVPWEEARRRIFGPDDRDT